MLQWKLVYHYFAVSNFYEITHVMNMTAGKINPTFYNTSMKTHVIDLKLYIFFNIFAALG